MVTYRILNLQITRLIRLFLGRSPANEQGSDVKTHLVWAAQVTPLTLLCRSGNVRVPKMSGQRYIVGGCSNRTTNETSLHRFRPEEKLPRFTCRGFVQRKTR